jgi:hypothetical protein
MPWGGQVRGAGSVVAQQVTDLMQQHGGDGG